MIGLLIIHYKDTKITKDFLESIKKNYNEKNTKICLLDNDKSFIKEKEKYPEIIYLKAPYNLGYAKGINFGVKYLMENYAGIEYFYILNNDMLIKEDIFSKLYNFMKKETNIGICSPVVLFAAPADKIYMAGITVDLERNYINNKYLKKNKNDIEWEIETTDSIEGCSMVIRKEVFEKIGYFDEKFENFLEDMDFCIRTKKSGWNISVINNIYIYHKAYYSFGESSFLSRYFTTRNRYYLFKKHIKNKKIILKNFFLWTIKNICRIIFNLFKWKIQNAKAISYAVMDGLLYSFKIK